LLGGTVLGLGKGERVFPLRPAPLPPLLIVHPDLYVSTPAVFRALPNVGYPFPEPLGSLPEGVAPSWRNDLTGAAIWVCPPLSDVRTLLLEMEGDPLLCGSGACWAARFRDANARDEALGVLQNRQPQWSSWAVD
jgi:4-diphosphocytidyl-2-C-methyl-D-erythritol kinase